MIPPHGLILKPLTPSESPSDGVRPQTPTDRQAAMRHTIQTDLLALVTDTHREDADQLTIGDALETRTEGHYCMTCASHQCEHAHATYPPEVDVDRTALARERVAAAGYFTGGELLEGCEA